MVNEWREVRLGEIAEIIMGQSPPGETYNHSGEGLPFFQGVADFGYRHPTPRVYCTAPSRIAYPGDILLSVRAPIGRVNVVDKECSIGRGLSIVRPRHSADARYIEFVLRYLEPQWHKIEGGGSVFGNATRDDLERLHIPWFESESDRCAIAHILGTLDDKIELNRRMSQTLEEMARALFKAWFVDFEPVRAKMEGRWKRGKSLPGLPGTGGFGTGEFETRPYPYADLFPDLLVDSELGEIPEGWEIRKLSDLCSTQYGYTASAVDEQIGPKFLRVTDINKQNWIEWDNVPHCEIDSDAKQAYALEIGDLVVARMADPGKSAIIEDDIDAVFASYLVRLKTRSLAHSYYVYGFLKSELYAEYAEGARSGSVQANMNARVIVGASLVVPPTKVMEQFLRAVLPLRQRLASNVHESHTLATLRDTLLPKLISSELRVKDAERFLKERGL
ncbi:MAG TPA: restriction endonuclease subunit S [Syntrophorhabdaceae bacterium]|nr:restriction endonuclease subunit S [Syntrophorhabdaceae bacterium]HOL04686.1 restriction endonuclease subunit S [Syntrophorhabdaceae bacterium]HPP41114.1 restriction endonuclease subunit S [Syntrophorhabdaceae bacterium]